jgi:hypothetical protein
MHLHMRIAFVHTRELPKPVLTKKGQGLRDEVGL